MNEETSVDPGVKWPFQADSVAARATAQNVERANSPNIGGRVGWIAGARAADVVKVKGVTPIPEQLLARTSCDAENRTVSCDRRNALPDDILGYRADHQSIQGPRQ